MYVHGVHVRVCVCVRVCGHRTRHREQMIKKQTDEQSNCQPEIDIATQDHQSNFINRTCIRTKAPFAVGLIPLIELRRIRPLNYADNSAQLEMISLFE